MAGLPVRQRIVVPFTGHVIGEGFNSDNAERVGTGLTVAHVGEDPQAPGQSAVFKFQMLTSQASLEKALTFGAELEARYMLFSGGATFDFAEQSAVNSTSTYILASCLVTNALRSGSGFTPTTPAQALIDAGDVDGFKQAFGDRYTQALHTGGEFHAVVRVTSSSTRHQQRISASLHAELNGLFAGGGFSASLTEATSDTKSKTEVNIQVHQTGGVGPDIQIPGTEANRIREHMNTFASAAHTSAAAYKAELLTYDTLALRFPSELELEDKRQVLEDCLQRRQRYWSAISDLTFAQSEDAPLIFADLPDPQTLVDLENQFRRVLNDLMAHARSVSSGTIPPAFFVATDEPPLPRFKRRTTGSFAVWWARRKDADLLADERLLIDRIAEQTVGQLPVSPEDATAEAMEKAADDIRSLDVSFREDQTAPKLRSLARLPEMTDAPLRELVAVSTDLEDLRGLEPYSRLESVQVRSSPLRDISVLTNAAGLTDLDLLGNAIADLAPVRAFTGLGTLSIGGNRIASLEPMRGLADLFLLSIARLVPPDGALRENPLTDARALDSLPRLANPFTSAARLDLRVVGDDDDGGTMTATRLGTTARFRLAVPDGETDELVLLAMWEISDPSVVQEPIVVTGLRARQAGLHLLAATPSADRTASVPAADLRLMFTEGPFAEQGGPADEFQRRYLGRRGIEGWIEARATG